MKGTCMSPADPSAALCLLVGVHLCLTEFCPSLEHAPKIAVATWLPLSLYPLQPTSYCAHTHAHSYSYSGGCPFFLSLPRPSLRANQSRAPKESLGTTTAIGTVPSYLVGQSNSWGLTQDPKLPPSGALFPPENNQINTECSEHTLVLS